MSYPPDDERYAALARYLAGECTPSESARIQRLLAEEPDRAKAMKALAGMMTRLEPPPMAPVDVDDAWLRVRDRMRDAEVAEAVVEAVEPAPQPEAPAVAMVVDAVEPAPQPEAPVVAIVVEAVEPAPEPEAPVVEEVVEAVELAPEPEAPMGAMVVEAVTVTAEPEAPARAPWWSAAVSAATRAGAALWKWVRGGR